MAVPCAEGDTCSYSGLETGVDCDCDPSGHFLCDSGGAGAPPFEPCNENRVPQDPGYCELSNGYCTRRCTESGCEVTCDGQPANVEWERECTPAMCDEEYWGWGGCEIDAGEMCSYKIDCSEPGVVGSVEGSCE